MRLWIANIEPGTDDATLVEFVTRYAKGITVAKVQRVDGDGSRPAALISFTNKKFDSLGKLKLRLDGLYWKGRKLACSTTVT